MATKAVFPLKDGVASTGSSSERARLDHVHPQSTAEDIGALPSDTKYAASPTIGGAAKSTAGIPWAQVDAGSTSTVFTASCPEITELKDGVCIMLMNGRVTSASGFTVNINGLGAKPVYQTLAAASRATTLFNINYTLLLVYNSKRVEGGCWDAYYGYDSNSNSIGYQLRTNSTSMQTTDKFYRYRLLFTAADNQHYVPVNTSTSTNATTARTVTQRPINPFGAIFFYGHTTAINANAYPTSSYMWTQYNFEMGYSFGALTLTQSRPVYIKCAPQSDGSAIIDSTTPYVQSLPSTADGKIYIFLGVASDTTTVELFETHPVYCYRNGGIQLWTGLQAEVDLKAPLASPALSGAPTAPTAESGANNTQIATTEFVQQEIAKIPAGGGGGGGGVTPETLLGNTPLKLTANVARLKLVGTGTVTYTLESDTVADFDILSGTKANATVSEADGVYKIKATSGASQWYNSYDEMILAGLTVGETYNFVFDAEGCTYNEPAHKTVGHYILYDGNGNTLVTRGATDGAHRNSYAFTATTTNVRLRWYASPGNAFLSGVSEATCNAIYINKAGTTAHTVIVNSGGTFENSVVINGVPSGVTVSSTPSCAVYSTPVETGSDLPLYGKKIVCFGDSLFGMFRGEGSAVSYIAETTGATCYNVGFGGCRMSDHPTYGYAAFSMWALATAVATGTWTDQDAQASSGSDYFPDQLDLLKSIDFNEVDMVVIHYGTNDFGGGVAIGENALATTHDTLCGALKYSIETLLGAYPNLRIYISLPVYRYWESGGVITYAETYTNSQNDTLPDVVSAMATVTEEYNIPIIDGYHGLGINFVNATEFLSDGTHHNAAGRKRFGTYIGARIIAQQ